MPKWVASKKFVQFYKFQSIISLLSLTTNYDNHTNVCLKLNTYSINIILYCFRKIYKSVSETSAIHQTPSIILLADQTILLIYLIFKFSSFDSLQKHLFHSAEVLLVFRRFNSKEVAAVSILKEAMIKMLQTSGL